MNFINELFTLLVRAGRIELPYTAWKAVILPLNYAREKLMISNKLPRSNLSFALDKTLPH